MLSLEGQALRTGHSMKKTHPLRKPVVKAEAPFSVIPVCVHSFVDNLYHSFLSFVAARS